MRPGLIIFCISVLSNSLAQNIDRKVTINVDQVLFPDFIKQIEEKTSIRFWYEDSLYTNLKVSLNVTNLSVDSVILRAIDDPLAKVVFINRDAYIFKNRDLAQSLPKGLFKEAEAKDESPAPQVDFSKYESHTTRAEQQVIIIGVKTKSSNPSALISGTVTNAKDGEPIPGASVFSKSGNHGVTTDAVGNFSLVLNKGKHSLEVNSVGMKNLSTNILLMSDGKLNLMMSEEITSLKEIVVESNKDARVRSLQVGHDKLSIKTVKNISMALGEADIMKAILTLPGVQSVGEAANGVNIRGGSANQNLILFNDATVYNPNHLFGFFSSFNPDVIKSIELYKTGIAPEYGGRLSSVIDVVSREGNLKKFSGSGGISPIAGRLALEGPLFKGKASYLVAGRSNYSNWLLHRVDYNNFKQSEASFYDLNFVFHYNLNQNNAIDVTAYQSNDRFKLRNDSTYSYGDKNISVKWRHIFNERLFSRTHISYNQYDNSVTSDANQVQAFQWKTGIKQWNFRTTFDQSVNDRVSITSGLSVIHYELSPGNMQPKGVNSLVTPDRVQTQRAIESALYANATYDISSSLSLSAGLRFSSFFNFGPYSVYKYANGLPRTTESIIDTINYSSNKLVSNYNGLEPRLMTRWTLSKTSSLKFSYNRIFQYIQVISNTTTLSPTDTWKLSDPYVKPQIGDQVSVGFYKSLKNHNLDLSSEAYYKVVTQSVDAKNGAVLFMNKHIETDLIPTRAKVYGIELMLRKNSGKLTGWLSYAYSRSLLQSMSNFSTETVNSGNYYPSNYDKPHAANLVANYKFNRRISLSTTVTYSTGRPITLPLAKYQSDGGHIYYSERNQYRVPDYFRADISLNLEGNHKIKKLAHSSWALSVYNLTGRHNVYSVYFTSNKGQIAGYQMSIFARPIPTLTYNFRF